MNFSMNHAPGAGPITQPVDLQSRSPAHYHSITTPPTPTSHPPSLPHYNIRPHQPSTAHITPVKHMEIHMEMSQYGNPVSQPGIEHYHTVRDMVPLLLWYCSRYKPLLSCGMVYGCCRGPLLPVNPITEGYCDLQYAMRIHSLAYMYTSNVESVPILSVSI